MPPDPAHSPTAASTGTHRPPPDALGRELLDAVCDAVVAIDAAGLVTYWGAGAVTLYGLSDADVLGRPLAEAYTYRWERPGDEQRAWVALERDGRWRGHNVHVLRSGEERHVESSVSVLRDAAGARAGLVAVIRDRTELAAAERAREAAERDLRESEQRFRAAFTNAAIGFAMTDADGRFVAVNRAYTTLLGYTEDELRARRIVDLVHRDDLEENRRRLERMLAGELADFVIENRYVRKGGEPVWVRKSVSLVRDAEGKPRWMIALVEDATQQHRIETSLRESEAQARRRAAELETVLDTVPAAVWIARDPRGDRIDANRFGAELLRRRPGQNVSITSPDADRPRDFTVLRDGVRLAPDELPMQQAARQSVELRDIELDLVFDDGEVRCLLGNAAPLGDGEGGAKGSVGAFVDVTARRIAERERDRLARQLQLALDAADLGWFVFDARTGDTEHNARYAEIFGVARDVRLPRVEVLERIHPDDRARVVAALEDALSPELPRPYAAEFRIVRPDGQVRWIEGHGLPLVAGAGAERRVESLIGTVEDVTERKQIERTLREEDRRKTAFLAVLSHELRNPLAPIRNALFLLDRAQPGSDAARRARTILHRQTEHLTRLVDDLLDIARISGGKIELRTARVDAREIVRRCVDDVHAAFEQRGVALLKAAADPAWVDADAARLAQMIGNLLHNALKFTPPGGRAEVVVQQRGGTCAIGVRDTGMGIAAEDLATLFTPFAQAERTRSHSQGGLGIGLSLVRELAALHGGSVRASSPGVGQGAEFVIELPLAAAPDDALAGPPAPQAATGLSILLVEDNEDAAATLADVLALKGHAVRTVGTGRDAVEAAARDLPQVIICDIGLPDLGGHDVIRAIRASGAGGRVFAVALTGYAQPQDREAALAAGFDAHLPKPPVLEELEALLVDAARRRAG
jgi:PAS domain S-box-containing protein